MSNQTNASAWKIIFEKYNIVEEVDANGSFEITAEQIKEFREPRLMTKFDDRSEMPQIFKDNGLSIMSISRGSYIIGRFAVFFPIDYKTKETLPIDQLDLETLDFSNLYSESSSIMFAYNSNIFKDAFKTKDIYFTTYGRMGTNTFFFNVDVQNSKGEHTGNTTKIDINKAQIEIDAGIETEKAFYIVEAKNRFVEDINLRQLYYPYKLWSEKIKKPVIPVFFVYNDNSFYLYICKFNDPDNINSLSVEYSIKFAASSEPITMNDINNIYLSIKPHTHDQIFPQADRMEKILDLLHILNVNKSLRTKEIADHFLFDIRQGNYYVSAAEFLGLIERNNGNIMLSKSGVSLIKMPDKERHLALVKLILEDCVFYKSYEYMYEESKIPPIDYVANLIKCYYPPKKKSDSDTPRRRAGTVTGWLKWIFDLTSP